MPRVGVAHKVSAIIDMDDPLAAEQPRRDTPPQSSAENSGSGTAAAAGAAEPKRRGSRKQDAQLKLDLKEIEEKLTELLKTPAIPMDAAGENKVRQTLTAYGLL